MNREQRRLANETKCQKENSPMYINTTVLFHGQWSRKAKPFGYAYMNFESTKERLTGLDTLTLPRTEVERAFQLDNLVMFYPSPRHSPDEMLQFLTGLSRPVDDEPMFRDLSLDDDETMGLHERVMAHAYGPNPRSMQFKKGRVCACTNCMMDGISKSLENKPGWRVSSLALLRVLDITPYVPENLRENLILTHALMTDIADRRGTTPSSPVKDFTYA